MNQLILGYKIEDFDHFYLMISLLEALLNMLKKKQKWRDKFTRNRAFNHKYFGEFLNAWRPTQEA